MKLLTCFLFVGCVCLVYSATETDNDLRELLVEILRKGMELDGFTQWKELKPEANIAIIGASIERTRFLMSAILKTVTESSGYDARLAQLKIPERKIFQVNTQGNRRFTIIDGNTEDAMKETLLSGALDAAILLVDASEMFNTQTRDLVILAKAAGVSDLIVFLDGLLDLSDKKDEEHLNRIRLQMEILLSAYDFGVSIIGGSVENALNGVPASMDEIKQLIGVMDQLPTPARSYEKPFKMQVQFVSRIVNFNNENLEKARAGSNVGMLLKGVEGRDISRGMLLATPNTFTSTTAFDAKTYFLGKSDGAEADFYSDGDWFQIQLFGANVNAQLTMEKKVYPQGVKYEIIRLTLDQPLVLDNDSHFLLSDGDKIIGYGTATCDDWVTLKNYRTCETWDNVIDRP